MAVQPNDQGFFDICAKVGIPPERAWDLLEMDSLLPLTSRDELAGALNFMGYYDEKADHLIENGVSFV